MLYLAVGNTSLSRYHIQSTPLSPGISINLLRGNARPTYIPLRFEV